MNRWLMWSGPEAAGGVATTHPELRRGRVWLATVSPDRRQRAVLLLSRDRDGGVDGPVDGPVLAAPVVRGTPATGRVAVQIPPGVDGSVVDVRRLIALDRSALVQPLARLAAPALARVDLALCDVLGLDVPGWPSDGEPSLEPRAAPAEELSPQPVLPPATNGAAPQEQPAGIEADAPVPQPAALAQLGLAPPPPPPPSAETTAPSDVDDIDGGNVQGGLDDHPIAQLFGRPRPASQPAPLRAPAGSPAADIRVADVMPQLLAIVQRRLHRSAPRLEAVLSQAGDEGRNLEWAAAAVRHASVRGVMQSTLDEIASEIAAVGTPEARRPTAR